MCVKKKKEKFAYSINLYLITASIYAHNKIVQNAAYCCVEYYHNNIPESIVRNVMKHIQSTS